MLFCSFVALASRAAASVASAPVELAVNVTNGPRGLIEVSEKLPAGPGALSLVYPEWIPGAHSPSGPVDGVIMMHIHAMLPDGTDGPEVPWRRDLVNLYELHTKVPAEAKGLHITFDFDRFGTATHGTVRWNELEWLPSNYNQAKLMFAPSLTIPDGWKEGGSLDIASQAGNTIEYKPETLQWLDDHPVIVGKYFKELIIWPADSPYGEHAIDVAADNEKDLDWPAERLQELKNIVVQERAVFGGVGHYRKYHWLLSLSQYGGYSGLEHHECSDDGDAPMMMASDALFKGGSQLLTHEFFHSWNGKAFRPAGLVNGGYTKPMKDNLLWSYEGMTEFYGELMPARSGIESEDDFAQNLARDVADQDKPGRTWRPLQDTADDASHAYGQRGGWSAESRGADYYVEDVLNWLAADALIIQKTDRKKSLDDYTKLFEGRYGNGKVFVHPYHETEIFEFLNKVYPYDWATWWHKRLDGLTAFPPVDGITRCGWKFEYTNTPIEAPAGFGRRGSFVDLSHGAGMTVSDTGAVDNVRLGSAAWKAGLGNGMTILKVNGVAYSSKVLTDAVMAAETSMAPIHLDVKQEAATMTIDLPYYGGMMYPHLVRVPGTPDLLKLICAPH